MYQCPLHNWYSHESPCPACEKNITSVSVTDFVINTENASESHLHLSDKIKQLQERVRELEKENEKYVGAVSAMMKMSDELIQLRAFVADVLRGQHGELKGEFILRIRRIARAMQKLNKEQNVQASVATDVDSSTDDDNQKQKK